MKRSYITQTAADCFFHISSALNYFGNFLNKFRPNIWGKVDLPSCTTIWCEIATHTVLVTAISIYHIASIFFCTSTGTIRCVAHLPWHTRATGGTWTRAIAGLTRLQATKGLTSTTLAVDAAAVAPFSGTKPVTML